MADLEQVEESIQVPPNTGVDGFLLAIRKILRLGRVQGINIGPTGKVTWTRLILGTPSADPLKELEGPELFDTVRPYFIITHNEIVELDVHADPLQGIARLFQKAATQGMYPVAWVSGTRSLFWDWHASATGMAPPGNRGEAYGLPLLYEEKIPDDVLILCTAHERGGAMIDVKLSFKLVMLTGKTTDSTGPSYLQAPAEVPKAIPPEDLPDTDLGTAPTEGEHE